LSTDGTDETDDEERANMSMTPVKGKVETAQDELTYKIIGLAMGVHTALGPGFTEDVYQRAMQVALIGEGTAQEWEYRIDVRFRDQVVGSFDLDLVAGGSVIMELKAIAALAPVHEQQAIAYLAASGLPVALLINFGATRLQYKRVFPPLSVQASPAYQARRMITI
jgi:GxxExxY protein